MISERFLQCITIRGPDIGKSIDGNFVSYVAAAANAIAAHILSYRSSMRRSEEATAESKDEREGRKLHVVDNVLTLRLCVMVAGLR